MFDLLFQYMEEIRRLVNFPSSTYVADVINKDQSTITTLMLFGVTTDMLATPPSMVECNHLASTKFTDNGKMSLTGK